MLIALQEVLTCPYIEQSRFLVFVDSDILVLLAKCWFGSDILLAISSRMMAFNSLGPLVVP